MTTAAWLAATLPAFDLASMSVEAVRAAAVAAGATGAITSSALKPERVAGAFGSDRLFAIDGHAPSAFAPLSGFFVCADGWVRAHGNYPHHAERLLSVLGLRPDSGRAEAAEAISVRLGADLEEEAASAGAILARVRTEAEWRDSAPGRSAARGPLVGARARDDTRRTSFTGGSLPLRGIKVLDLTRVLAGPVCGRTLALLGADVLRIDPPWLPEIEWQHLDTSQGKRSALLDLRANRARAQALLDRADVLVTGYRPGSIEQFGLRLPAGIVRARVNAWGDEGPWAMRRGFDSIVQAASGIAMIESTDGVQPGTLPAQVLDHATGYLLAAAITDALVAGSLDGRGRDVSASLARTAMWLLDADGRDPEHPPAATSTTAVTHNGVTTARPAVPGFDDYPAPAPPWGTDVPEWS